MASNSDKWKELVFLSLGSNLGNSIKHLELARELINQHIGNIELESSIYKTEAWGQEKLNLFYNQVIGASTKLPASRILDCCQNIELKLGRAPKKKLGYENRIVDIDLLIYNTQVVQTINLVLPHPKMHLRNFVLVSLAEIAPDLQHPELHQSIEKLKKNCSDHNKVERIE